MPSNKPPSEPPGSDASDPARSTMQALLDAGLNCFARSGYTGSRLTDIAAEAGLTTGALYGHFASKSDFFDALFASYGKALVGALHNSPVLESQFVSWISVSRTFRGVVRASAEILHRRPDHLSARRELRTECAGLLAWHLREPLTQRDARLVARTLVDVLDQYMLMEVASRMKPRDPEVVARALSGMVRHGVYVT